MARSPAVRRARRWTLLGIGSALGFVLSTAGGYGAFASFSNATQQVNTEGGMSLASVVLTGDPGGTALTETVVDMQPGDYRERVIDLTVPYDADVTYSVKADLLSDATPSAIPGVSQVGDALNAIDATNTGLAATDLSDLNAPAGQGGLFVEIYRCTGGGNVYESTNGVIASRTDDREVSCNNTGVPQGDKGNGTGVAGVDPATLRRVSSTDAGSEFTCSIRNDQTLWCSGWNDDGQLGDGTTSQRTNPTQVGSGTDWASVGANSSTACGIRTIGTLWCWGPNWEGQVGDGTTTPHQSPTQVGTDNNWSSVSVGGNHTCGIRTTGTLWCWGYNGDGSTGLGTLVGNALSPTQVGINTNWASVSSGTQHTCAVTTGNTLWCWGTNANGRTGLGTTVGTTLTPTQVGLDSDWALSSSGYFHSCATKTTRTLWCWGANTNGRTGLGITVGTTLTPTQVGSATNWLNLSAGWTHTCATTAANTVWCWGYNDRGQLGDGTTTQRLSPNQAGTDAFWDSVTVGQYHSCASTLLGARFCWGENDGGQLGDGTTTPQLSPVVSAIPGLGGQFTTPVVVRPAGQTLRLLIRVRFANDGTTDGRQNTLSGESILLTHRFALVERAGGAV